MTARVFEAGTRCRRHLVLEPLSRRPFRFRKLDLRLFVLQGAAAGMGLEGAFLAAARHAGIPQPRRRQVRSAPRHAVPQHGHGRALGRRSQPVDRDPGKRPAGDVSLPVHRGRHPLRPYPAAPFRAATVSAARPITRRAGRTRRWTSPANASASSAPAPPPSRRSRKSPKQAAHLTVFQRRPNWAAPLHNAKISKEEMAGDQDPLRRDLCPLRRHPELVHPPGGPPQDAGRAAGGARGVLGEAVRRTGLRHLDGQFPRHPGQRESQRRDQRIHRQKDPPAREGSEGRGQADPEGPSASAPAACRWKAAISRPTTATT